MSSRCDDILMQRRILRNEILTTTRESTIIYSGWCFRRSIIHKDPTHHMCGCPCWRSLSLSLFLSFLSFFLSFNISSSNLFSPFTRRGTERDMKGIVNQKQTPSYPLSKYQIRLLSSIPSLSSFLKRNSRRNSQIIVMYPLAINSYPFSASSPLFSANFCVRPNLKGWEKKEKEKKKKNWKKSDESRHCATRATWMKQTASKKRTWNVKKKKEGGTAGDSHFRTYRFFSSPTHSASGLSTNLEENAYRPTQLAPRPIITARWRCPIIA